MLSMKCIPNAGDQNCWVCCTPDSMKRDKYEILTVQIDGISSRTAFGSPSPAYLHWILVLQRSRALVGSGKSVVGSYEKAPLPTWAVTRLQSPQPVCLDAPELHDSGSFSFCVVSDISLVEAGYNLSRYRQLSRHIQIRWWIMHITQVFTQSAEEPRCSLPV